MDQSSLQLWLQLEDSVGTCHSHFHRLCVALNETKLGKMKLLLHWKATMFNNFVIKIFQGLNFVIILHLYLWHNLFIYSFILRLYVLTLFCKIDRLQRFKIFFILVKFDWSARPITSVSVSVSYRVHRTDLKPQKLDWEWRRPIITQTWSLFSSNWRRSNRGNLHIWIFIRLIKIFSGCKFCLA